MYSIYTVVLCYSKDHCVEHIPWFYGTARNIVLNIYRGSMVQLGTLLNIFGFCTGSRKK